MFCNTMLQLETGERMPRFFDATAHTSTSKHTHLQVSFSNTGSEVMGHDGQGERWLGYHNAFIGIDWYLDPNVWPFP